jgi:tetratricopeptide (TPR) repeat protein
VLTFLAAIGRYQETRVTDHPSPELLRRFALGDLPAADADSIAVHLLHGCARCRAEVENRLPLPASPASEPAERRERAERESFDPYDRAIEAAIASVRLHGTAAVQVRKRTHQILAELRAGDTPEVPPPSPHAMAPSAPPHASEDARKLPPAGAPSQGAPVPPPFSSAQLPQRFPLFDAALRHSWELRSDDPRRMIELARFATRIAPTLGEDGYTPAQVADFQARAWGELGNAYRVGEELSRAAEAMATAFEHLARGTGDELLLTRLLSLQASVLSRRSQFRAALEVLSRLHAIHLRRGDRHHAGRALIQAGGYLGYWGMPEVGLRLTSEGMEMIDAELDPNLQVGALMSTIDLLVDCRRFQEASDQLRKHRSRLLTGQGLLLRLMLKALEGRLEAGLGNLERAARAFVTARRRYKKAGVRRMAALIALELAAVRMRQGRFDEANPLIEEAIEQLVAIEAAGEALTALKFLRTSREMSTLTTNELQDVAAVLRRSNRSDLSGR